MTAPKLRFKEFDGDWIKVDIQTLVDEKIIDKPMDGNHGEIHPTSADYVEDGIPFVMATDVIDGKVHLDKSKKIKKTQADSLRKGFSLEGDILLTHKATIGNVAKVPELKTPYIILTPQVTYYRILNRDRLTPDFIKSTFEAPFFQNELLALCTGATRLYIGISEQRKLPLSYPSIKEQTKIATFLSAVDEKISQLTQKHQLLSQYKQSMMQNLFSQQIRFKADDGSEFEEWKTVRVKDIFDVTRGQVLAVSQTISVSDKEYKFPVFSSQTKQNGLMGFYKKYLFEDAITWTTDGANAGEVNFRKGKFYCTNVCGVLKSEKGYANQCIAAILNRVSRKYVSYVGNPKLMNNVMSEIPITIPSNISEQTKIANFLSTIDQKIEVTAQQIEQAKQWKKGLLQQMFV